jgi:hypothetical protein
VSLDKKRDGFNSSQKGKKKLKITNTITSSSSQRTVDENYEQLFRLFCVIAEKRREKIKLKLNRDVNFTHILVINGVYAPRAYNNSSSRNQKYSLVKSLCIAHASGSHIIQRRCQGQSLAVLGLYVQVIYTHWIL